MTDSDFGIEAMLLGGMPPEGLQQARQLLGSLVKLETSSVHDSLQLATRLQGVSRAVSTIVLAQATLEMPNPEIFKGYSDLTLLSLTEKVALNFADPVRQGRVFTARPGVDRTLGASMEVTTGTDTKRTVRYNAELPTDWQIDKLLGQESPVHDALVDIRGADDSATYHPFAHSSSIESVQRYFGFVLDLSGELLRVTEPGQATAPGN